jgi:ribosome recycling factor
MTKPKIVLRTDDTPDVIRTKLLDTTYEERLQFVDGLKDDMREIRTALQAITETGDELCDTYEDMQRILDIVEAMPKDILAELN